MEAHRRGVERGCDAIQVFNQSPRMWRPTRWKPDDVAEFLELMKEGPIESVTIHAVYLINPATKDREMRRKSADSLIHALRMGDEIRADGVVIHPGSTVGEPHESWRAPRRCSSTRWRSRTPAGSCSRTPPGRATRSDARSASCATWSTSPVA